MASSHLTADENGVIETSRAHGKINWLNGFAQFEFTPKQHLHLKIGQILKRWIGMIRCLNIPN